MTSAFLNRLVFDHGYYIAKHPDLNLLPGAFESAKNHWLNFGINEGRQGSHAFDPKYYLQNNSDLSNYYGRTNYSAAINHFLGHGLKEGRRGTSSAFLDSLVFDPAYYLAKYPDLNKAYSGSFESAKFHWLNFGINEGRQGSHSFDPKYYLNSYSDLSSYYGDKNYTAAINHFLGHGLNEGRSGISSASWDSLVFDPAYYLAKYADLNIALSGSFESAKIHWLSFGIKEGRQGSHSFDPKYYLQQNRDLSSYYGDKNYSAAIKHFLGHGLKEGRRGTSSPFLDSLVFDPAYYLAKYPDLNKAYSLENAKFHWLHFGIKEGRQGSHSFDPKYYLKKYVDIARGYGPTNYHAAINHFLEYGIKESRIGSFSISPSAQSTSTVATIYEHSNYGGKSLQLGAGGTYSSSFLLANGFNDSISSLSLANGYYMEAYVDPGLSGAVTILGTGTSYIGDAFNDRISSIRIVAGSPPAPSVGNNNRWLAFQDIPTKPSVATIYEHSNYNGKSLSFTEAGEYHFPHIANNGFNDLASSLKVSPGYYIEAYADPLLRGASAIFSENKDYVGHGLENKISSLRIVRGTPPKVNQGVWNKSGFVLGVNWADPITGITVKSERLPSGQGSYITAHENPYRADLWIWGKEVAQMAVVAGAVTAVALTAGAALPAAGYIVVAKGAGYAIDFMATGVESLQNEAEIFWTGTPSLDGKHLDVWNTVWNPQVGSGGPL